MSRSWVFNSVFEFVLDSYSFLWIYEMFTLNVYTLVQGSCFVMLVPFRVQSVPSLVSVSCHQRLLL